jgi:hypothetical protein
MDCSANRRQRPVERYGADKRFLFPEGNPEPFTFSGWFTHRVPLVEANSFVCPIKPIAFVSQPTLLRSITRKPSFFF